MLTRENHDIGDEQPKLSLCMIVKDEEKWLDNCLLSAVGIANEIIIGDTGSTDGTIMIAKKFGAAVLDIKWQDDFSMARNQVLAAATGNWILHLDADEELTPGSKDKIAAIVNKTHSPADPQAYYVSIHDNTSPEKFGAIRLFRNYPDYRYKGIIHESIMFGDAAALPRFFADSDIEIIHHGYAPSIVDARSKHERNKQLLTAALKKQPDDPRMNYYYGHLLDTEGRYPEAIEYYKKAVLFDKDKTFPAAIRGLLMLLEYTDQTEEGLNYAISGIRDHPDYTDLYYLAGLMCLRVGRITDAANFFEKTEELGPLPMSYPTYVQITNILAKRELATCYRLMGEIVRATQLYKEVLHIVPSDAYAARGLIESLMQSNLENEQLVNVLLSVTSISEEIITQLIKELRNKR